MLSDPLYELKGVPFYHILDKVADLPVIGGMLQSIALAGFSRIGIEDC